jgi:serine O-acetyltransferase
MIISISRDKLFDLLTSQLDNLFRLKGKSDVEIMDNILDDVLAKTERCFSYNKNKYYHKDGQTYFHPFHSGQYSIFLYFLARSLFLKNQELLADKVYCLNKTLNGVDIYHEVELPDIFGLDHPVGTVIGRAKFSDYFYFTQNCTIGNNHGIYPSLGRNVTLLAAAMVIGNCKIGDNCVISAKTFIKDQDIPPNSLVFGSSPDLVIKNKEESYFVQNSFFSFP